MIRDRRPRMVDLLRLRVVLRPLRAVRRRARVAVLLEVAVRCGSLRQLAMAAALASTGLL